MPHPTRPASHAAPAPPPRAAPGASPLAPLLPANGPCEEARRKAAVDLLMLHACLSKLLAPQAGEHCFGSKQMRNIQQC